MKKSILMLCALMCAATAFGADTIDSEKGEKAALGKVGALADTGSRYRGSRIIVADFESTPSCYLKTRAECWGSAYPGSRLVGVFDPQFDPKNVHSGSGSYRLMNDFRSQKNWGCFSINLGPVTDITKDPIGIKPLDVSAYLYFSFWVKGAKGGEKFKIIFRDSSAETYMPVTIFTPDDDQAETKWKQVVLNLSEVKQKLEGYTNRSLNLASLVALGIEVGDNIGNARGATIYIDDLEFTR
jgi:hypothetical protein